MPREFPLLPIRASLRFKSVRGRSPGAAFGAMDGG